MKTLITTAEIILAVRTHFAIAENVDITFSHVAGHEGLVAIADTAPTFGDAVEEVKAIASETKTTRTRRSPVKADVADDEDVKPATTKRTFGKKKAEEVVEDADDADVDQDEAEEEEQPKATTKKRSFGKKATAPVEDEDDQDDGEADEDEVEEEKPATKKRSFGAKKKAVVQEDEDEGQDDADSDDEEEEVEEKPAKRSFGARKTVFGKK